MHTSNTENSEQTFDEKLDAILADYGENVADQFGGDTDEHPVVSSYILEAKQAIKTLVLEDVVGEDEEVNRIDRKVGNSVDKEVRNEHRHEQRQIINPQKEVESYGKEN